MKQFNIISVIIVAIALLITSFALFERPERKSPLKLQGSYITNDSEALYTFSGDSLYIDCANSGCGINAFKLSYQGMGKYKAKDIHGGDVYLSFKRLRHDTICILWGDKIILDKDTLKAYTPY